ncbi:hypothetical protein FA10DRAFT_269630 [Acaromyces ingoldii]|uniref:Autophagy protein 5 n=1 Tax=Acaromyces ingoldii TaxID=215250 RepID=A0A316YBX0_9BASI|nr:hypothetical protein FA10DRAFT_269630 [Acaromyces ingoldii]PWN87026.1 hypothetical protein FA10DRAFT_269630 [Acaromyces ingoldii]
MASGIASPSPSHIAAGGSGGVVGGSGSGSSSTGGGVAGAATRFRRLVWEAAIPVVVGVESGDLPSGSDRSVETYYASAARISYLPLLLAEVRRNLLPLVLDGAALDKIEEKDCWFAFEGTPLRWHWPIGLLYDYHTSNAAPSQHRMRTPSASSPLSSRRASHQAPPPSDESYFPGPPSSLALPPQAQQNQQQQQSQQHSQQQSQQQSQPQGPPIPWRLTLRLRNPPLDKLHSTAGLASCRASFMSMLKEADFVRYGSTKRVTNLRKSDQDQLWDGVVQHDFDLYWAVAAKLVPVVPDGLPPLQQPTHDRSRTASAAGDDERFNTVSSTATARPSLTQQHNESQTSLAAASMHSVAPSEAPSLASTAAGPGPGSGSSSSAVRSVPMRFHLVDGAPIVQEPVAPYLDDGRPNTIHLVLSGLFPLLFPPTPTFGTHAAPPPALAYPVVQGIRLPLETDVAWLGAALPSADGWVAVCINLLIDGEEPVPLPPTSRLGL